MLLDWRLQAALLLLLLARAAGGAPREPAKAACSSPGCGSPEGAHEAPCEEDKRCRLRAAGEPCGVYTPGCARGLRCVPLPGERAPLHALLGGKGVCAAPSQGGGNRTEAQPAAGGSRKMTHRVGHSTPEPLPLQSQAPLQEAPCRMHLSAILQELKAPLYLNGEDIFIPNCDTKGFYRRKQCRASKGQKRGQCWCVDKRGHRLEEQEESPLCLLANSD